MMEHKQTGSAEGALLKGLLFGSIDSEAKRMRVCLASTMLLGLLAHGYGFLNFTINDDSLYEFYLEVCAAWKLCLGRFMEPVLRYLMGEVIVLPWLTGLCGLLFAGLAVHLISKMFSLNTVWENILLGGICVTNTTVIAMIASFVHDFCGDMLALLLAVCAAYTWFRMKQGFSWKLTLLGAACLVGSVGFYQTYPAVTATLICIDMIRDLVKGESLKNVFRCALRAIPMIVIGVIGYAACVLVTFRVFDTGMAEVYDRELLRENDPLHLAEVMQVYAFVLSDLFLPNDGATAAGGGIQGVFQGTAVLVCGVNLALALLAGAAIVRAFCGKKTGLPEAAVAVLLILVLPLFMMWASVFSNWFHHIMRYAVCLYYLLILVVLRQGRVSAGKWQAPILVIMIGAVIFSNVQLANTAYMKKDLERQATLSTVTRMLSRLEQYDGYEYGQSPVAVIGQVGGVGLEAGGVSYITGLNQKSQTSDKTKLEKYFEIVLQYPVQLCSDEEDLNIVATEAFQNMGTFPEKNCIATINGVVVIKMADQPVFRY